MVMQFKLYNVSEKLFMRELLNDALYMHYSWTTDLQCTIEGVCLL